MTDRVLKVYIKDKYGLKVKNLGCHGYYLLEEESIDTLNNTWSLYNRKIYLSISEIIDELKAGEKN